MSEHHHNRLPETTKGDAIPDAANPYAPPQQAADANLVVPDHARCIGNILLCAIAIVHVMLVVAFLSASPLGKFQHPDLILVLLFLGLTGLYLAAFARTTWKWFSTVFFWSLASCLLSCSLGALAVESLGMVGLVTASCLAAASLYIPMLFNKATRRYLADAAPDDGFA